MSPGLKKTDHQMREANMTWYSLLRAPRIGLPESVNVKWIWWNIRCYPGEGWREDCQQSWPTWWPARWRGGWPWHGTLPPPSWLPGRRGCSDTGQTRGRTGRAGPAAHWLSRLTFSVCATVGLTRTQSSYSHSLSVLSGISYLYDYTKCKSK